MRTRSFPVQTVIAAATCVWLVACETPSPPEYSGADLYAGNCSVCHGVYAEGDGPASALIGGTVPDLRQLAANNGGVFPGALVHKIIDGRDLSVAHSEGGTMPKWGEEFQLYEGYSKDANARVRAKINALVNYLAEIQIED